MFIVDWGQDETRVHNHQHQGEASPGKYPGLYIMQYLSCLQVIDVSSFRLYSCPATLFLLTIRNIWTGSLPTGVRRVI